MIKATEFLECFQIASASICRDAQEGLSRYSAEKCLPANSKEFSSLTAEKVFLCMAVVCGHELTFPKMHPVGCFGDDNREQLNVRHFLCISGELLNMSMMHGHGEEEEEENKAVPPPIQGKLEVTLERNPGGKTMTMGLTAKGCIRNVGCIFSSPVFNHTEIPGRSVCLWH